METEAQRSGCHAASACRLPLLLHRLPCLSSHPRHHINMSIMSSPHLSSPCMALVLIVVLLALCLPRVSIAQPPPPPPPSRFHTPDDMFHGWDISDLAADPNRDLLYIIDSLSSVVAINTTREELSWTVVWDDPYVVWLDSLTVDSRSVLYVLGWLQGSYRPLLHVISPDWRLRQTLELRSLTPPLQSMAQLVTDSNHFVYLTSALPFPGQTRVWVLDGDSYEQVDSWLAPVPVAAPRSRNITGYVLAIDGSDTLYFQQNLWERRTFLVSTDGQLVGSLNALPRRPDFIVTDLVIDSRQQLYLAGKGDSSVLLFDAKGGALPVLSVLNSGTDNDGPHLAIDSRGGLHVSDPYSNEVLAVTASGDISRAYYSKAATLSGAGELLVDANNGDLLVSDAGGNVIAQRLSSRDGSLIYQYRLPGRLSEKCESWALDLGSRWSRIYVLLSCSDFMSPQSWLLHVVHPNGKVLAEYRLPFGGTRLRVDEWNSRLFVSDWLSDPPEVHVFDLQGRCIANLSTSNPPFSWITDIVLFPDLSGLAVLDPWNHRVVGLYANNTLAWLWRSNSSMDEVTDLAYASDARSFYFSQVNYFLINGSFSHNSSVQRVSMEDGQVLDEYVGRGQLPLSGGPTFSAIALSQRGELFAYDYMAESLFVWRPRTEADQSQQRSETEQRSLQPLNSGRAQRAFSPLLSKSGRHQTLSRW